MFFFKTDSNKSKTIEALIPMIDLFAVLAIVFMIYSSDEILASQEQSQETIDQIASEYKKLQEEVAAAEQARQERREILARNAVKSLEEIEAEREQKAKELVTQFTQMLAEQQSQAAVEYERLVAKFEVEHEQEVERQKAELEVEKQKEVETKFAELEEQKETEVSSAKEEFEKELTAKEAVLEATTEGILAAEMERVKDLASQKAEFEQQQRLEVAKLETQNQAAVQAAEEAARQRAAAEAEQVLAKELAAQQAMLEAQKARELAAAQAAAEESKRQALAKELAAQQATLEAQKAQELSEAQAAAEKAAEKAAKAAAEAAKREVRKAAKEQAKAEVEAEHAKELAEQLAKLEAEKEAELKPFMEAEEAKKEAQKVRKQIVDNLLKNFKDSDEGDVDIDGKTGRVRINFQESYFVRGSAELSDSMKELLRVMIPKYAKSIYENEGAAKQVESLKISGLTSPIFRGRYFDINDTSPEGEEAREYNLKLSNDRALAMYNFIFDVNEMGDYEYRAQLKADLGIEALGYRTATPVPSHLVGERAACLEYDCKKEQASILEFRLYSEK
ncbi:MAG: hypothetical protein GWN21_00975 [Gammaproteobacteria bacterium]|nr:hypothetical protein [Gammaproteobacteria bacterium]NIP87633.1 hypothetical protein [Gammaproteobacteria bacterium]NIR21958.1 hypothetical protein [Gammaproteobacteria bacterium]NIS03654.1 hypothetical protein [Gammaproteobacteria bacterium]NIU40669.1 hypothetical protein [Gammaproteobacteria bacterium]